VIPNPASGQVRVHVQACGICHSDELTKEGLWPGIQYPRIPGHEIAGVIDEVGAGVTSWKKGQRVGVGWHGGQDNTCPSCRRGDFRNCRNLQIPGISYDGGYQQYMLAPVEALVPIPEGLSAADAAPLLCAGITTYNPLRRWGVGPGTVSVNLDMDAFLSLLAVDGTIVSVGAAPEPVTFNGMLLGARRTVTGSMIGGITLTQEMLDFCGEHGLGADVEVIPASQVNQAYERVLASDVRYRFVIDIATLN